MSIAMTKVTSANYLGYYDEVIFSRNIISEGSISKEKAYANHKRN